MNIIYICVFLYTYFFKICNIYIDRYGKHISSPTGLKSERTAYNSSSKLVLEAPGWWPLKDTPINNRGVILTGQRLPSSSLKEQY